MATERLSGAGPVWALRLLPGVFALAVLLLLFKSTGLAMVGIWMRSETFAHAFLVPPISMWLVWRRREALARLPLRSAPWFLVPIALVCLLWLLGELAGVNAATQFALVCLIVLVVPALFGTAIAREILFPLLFLFFSVPMGEFLVPVMMEGTADFTVLALRASGIPVYREGLNFIIPSGNWSVVEACSGVRYLIASFMVGTLFAYLNYRSARRRVIFMVVSVIVPVVANWLRAYLIVMLGHLSSNTLAVGADHLLYGWVFFGVVILVMFMVGARWSEPDEAASAAAAPAGAAGPVSSAASPRSAWAVAVAVALLLGVTQYTQARLQGAEQLATTATAAPTLPAQLDGGWALDAQATFSDWAPNFQNPSAVIKGVYRAGDRGVGVWMGLYRDQGVDRKLITSTNTLIEGLSERWVQTGGGRRVLGETRAAVRAATAELRQPGDLKQRATQRLLVAQLYWIDGHWVTSDVEGKLRLAVSRLLGRGDHSAVLMLYVPLDDRDAGAEVLDTFAARNLARFDALLQAAAPAR